MMIVNKSVWYKMYDFFKLSSSSCGYPVNLLFTVHFNKNENIYINN
jgi:hypothetical protein